MERPIVVGAATDATEWDAFVHATAEATGYHLWRWRLVFERAFGHHTEYLAARDPDGIVGICPLVVFCSRLFGNFSVSLPFVNYGGIVARDPQVANALRTHARALAARLGSSHVEFRHVYRQFATLPCKQHKVAMTLRLAPDVESMWRALDRKVRNQIKKAEKSALTASIGSSELLDDFYRIFAHNMRDLGTPVYSIHFFREVLAQFPESTRVFMVRAGRTPVAGAISFTHRGIIEVPWASSLREYRALCPNNLLYWTAITHAIANGCSTIDFGRSTPDEGTYHFKRQWGAEPEPLWWEYDVISRTGLPDQSPKNPKLQTAIAVWKHLPVRLTTLIGPAIVRSIP